MLSIIAIVFIACNTDLDPVAHFTVVPSTPKAGETVQLTNKSVNAHHYMWANGNSNSTSKDWALKLSTTGKYSITLQVWNKDKSKTDSKTIDVYVN